MQGPPTLLNKAKSEPLSTFRILSSTDTSVATCDFVCFRNPFSKNTCLSFELEASGICTNTPPGTDIGASSFGRMMEAMNLKG